MKVDTRGLEAFIAIAERSSFRAAADAVHITQTGLSRRLQNLEGSLGVRLIERSTRSVSLTPIGRDFLPRARRLLGDLGVALTEIRENGRSQRGDVTISCIPTAGVQYLPRVIQRYTALYPENRIRILDRAAAGVVEAVVRREAEFGVTLAGMHDDELVATPLLQDRFVIVCRQDHPLAKAKSVPWKALEPYALIFAGMEGGNRRLLDAAVARDRLRLKAFYDVQLSSTAIGMVAEGVGIAIVPELAMQKGAQPALRAIALVAPAISRSLVLLTRRNAYLTPAAKALSELLLKNTRD
jgi:DNA-binding transcriptional LysR family regulator